LESPSTHDATFPLGPRDLGLPQGSDVDDFSPGGASYSIDSVMQCENNQDETPNTEDKAEKDAKGNNLE
jgi:hypothetical protein